MFIDFEFYSFGNVDIICEGKALGVKMEGISKGRKHVLDHFN